jgi:hypothetical protein
MLNPAEIEARRRKAEAYRETLANPFRRKRRANGEARYLNVRETAEHSTLYDRDGNRR